VFAPSLFAQSTPPPPSYKNYGDSFTLNRSVVQSTNTVTECLGYRPDINTFSNEDVELLISLIIDYVTKDLNPNYDPAEHPALKYDIVAIHSNYGGNSSAWHSDDEMFFSWHRDYIRGLEEYLLDRSYSQFVPLPAWNPINAVPAPFLEPEAMVEEVYNTPFEYKDENGMTTSIFQMPLQQVQPGTLEMYTVDDMTCSQFPDIDEFAGFIRANDVQGFTSHNAVHVALGGAMIEVQTASAAAIFWLFHAYVDDIYYCYQSYCGSVVPNPDRGMVDKVVFGANPIPAISFEPFPNNTVEIDNSGGSNICSDNTDVEGQYSLLICPLPTGNSDIEVAPDPDPLFTGVLDNVSTADLIAMQRHILGVDPFDSPYKYIAADVNNSGTITALDQIVIRKVILSISSQFHVDSWRYIPNYALSNNAFNTDFDNDPFTAVWNHPNGQQYPYIAIQGGKSYLDALDLNMQSMDLFYENTWSFRGVKSGNADLREDEGNLSPGTTEFLYDPHSTISAGTEFSVEVVTSGAQEDIYGYQFAALFDDSALEVVGFDRGDLASFTPANFSTSIISGVGGVIRTLWYGSGTHGEPAYFSLSSSETSLFKVVLKAKTNISKLEDVISLSEEALSPYFFDNDGDTHPVSLKLKVEPGTPPKHLLHNLFPNPISSQVTFEVQSSEVVPITLRLQDHFGQVVTISGTTSVGIQGYTFPQLSTLQNGALFYRITAGSEVMTGYVIKQ